MVERALADLVLGAPLDAAAPGDVAAWLARNDLSPADAAALARDVERLSVYRGLVRTTLRDVLALSLPRTVERLGPRLDEALDRFLAARGPRTRYVRDVTEELIDFCEPLWAADAGVPPWLVDLARHESLRVVVAAAEDDPAQETAEVALDRALVFQRAARVVRYAHAVHRLPEDLTDRTVPAAEATALLAYRAPDHEVRYLELTPLAAALVERLAAGEALGVAVSGACQALGVLLTDDVRTAVARLLGDLGERGVLLGGSGGGPQELGR